MMGIPRFLPSAIVLCLAWGGIATSRADTLTIPGGGLPQATLQGLAAAFNARHPEIEIRLPPSSGNAGAVRAVKRGEASLGRVSRRLTPEEISSGLREVVYAKDAVIFGVGAKVDVTGLSGRQLADIFSGSTVDWGQLGGSPAPIRVLIREPTETGYAVIKSRMPAFGDLKLLDNSKLANSDTDLIDLLDKYKRAVGWLTAASLRASKSGAKALAVDGIAPTPENLDNGRYTLFVERALIYREAYLSPAAKKFIAFVLSEEGRRILRQSDLVPVAR